MIDIEVVREKYASMPDSELILLATDEAQNLTEESAGLLVTELKNRNLEAFIAGNEERRKQEAENKISNNITEGNPLIAEALAYAMDQKESGKNDEIIISELLEMGLEENEGHEIISSLAGLAKQRLKKADLEKLTGGLIFMSGLAVTFLPLTGYSNRLTYIIAWCAILFGASRSLKGLFNLKRFSTIIKNINAEQRERPSSDSV